MRLGGRRFLLSLAIIGAAVCLALGLTLPALAFAGCGGSSDKDTITDIIKEVGNEPAK